MAVAAPVDPFWLARRESEYHPQKIPKSTTGLDDECARDCVAFLLAGQEAGICMCTSPPPRRCDSAWARCGDSTPTTELSTSDLWTAKPRKSTLVVELLQIIERTLATYGTPPPSYNEAVRDVPPDYSSTGCLAEVSNPLGSSAPPLIERCTTPSTKDTILGDPTMSFAVDFGDTSGFQTHGKKQAKKAAKQAAQAKWADDGDENNDAVDGEEGGGDAPGGGGGDGGSGNGDGGAGEDDGDDWNAFGSGKKNKKNKKKSKKEEEEERRKKEEEKKEEEKKEEEKKKEEEAAASSNPLSWADETADPNPDDDWGGFTATGKKGKKNKKGKAEDGPPPPPDPPTSAFHEISLDDGAPQLDLSFGGTGAKSKTDTGFASFGNNWNTGGLSWDFGGVGTATTTDTKDAKSTKDSKETKELGDNNPWSTSSFGSKAKSKKKTMLSNFDFGDLGGGEDAAPDARVDESTKDIKDSQNDDWGGAFTSVNKKDKKKNKKNVNEEEPQPDSIVDVVPETQPAGNDTWDAWGTAGKKKKGKKGVEEEALPPPPPPVPTAPPEPVPADEWSFGSKKDKKKSKRGAATEGSVKSDDAPAVVVVPEHEPVHVDLWSTSSKKDKKSKKKGGILGVEEDSTPPPVVVGVSNTDADDAMGASWFSTGSSKKDKKGKKKNAIEEVVEDEPIPADDSIMVLDNDASLGGDDSWSTGWAGATTKKEKKGKKKGGILEVEEDPAPLTVVDVSNTATDDAMGASWFSTGSSKKDKKGKKKNAIDDVKGELVPTVDPIMELDNDASLGGNDDWTGSWAGATSKKDKKNKKKGLASEIEEPAPMIEALPTIVDVPALTDDFAWAPAATKKKDKKGRKSSVSEKSDGAAAPPPPPPPPAPMASELAKTDGWDTWGAATFSKDKKKKGRKNSVSEKSDGATAPPPPPIGPEPAKTDDWDAWGTTMSSKDKKKGKFAEAEPVVVVVTDAKSSKDTRYSPDQPAENTWGDTWGLSAKDKKKREKEAKKNAFTEVVEEPLSSALLSDPPPGTGAPVDDNSWDTWGPTTTKDKKKGKKGKQEPPPPAPTPPAQGLTPESTPPPIPDLDDQDINGWSTLMKSDSKSAKPSTKKGTISRTTTSTSKTGKESDTKLGLSKTKSKDKSVDFMDFGDELMDDEPETKEPPNKKPAKEETPAKAVKGFWGSYGSTSTTKTKMAKEKEEEKAEDEALLTEELDEDEIIEILDEAPPPKKGGRSKTDSKLSKVDSKGSDKSSKSGDKKKKDDPLPLVDIAEEKADDKKAGKAKAGESKLKKADGKSSKGAAAAVAIAAAAATASAVVEEKAEEKAEERKGGWGATSKKTAGKKSDETKKEIKQHGWANQSDALDWFANEPEPAMAADAAASSVATGTPKTMSSTTAKSKAATKSSIADRIKAFEPPKEEKTVVSAKDRKKSSAPAPSPPAPEPPEEESPPPLKRSTTLTKTKSKPASASKSAPVSKKKEVPAAPVEEKKTSKDSVPGSFPIDGADDDFGDLMDFAPSPQKVTRTPTKFTKSSSKAAPAIVEASMPPTPPPEPVVEKPAKKQRPKIVRDSNSSWAFWGPAPKKEVKKVPKAKDDSEASPTSQMSKKEKPSGLSRSQSTKTSKEKQKEVEKEREVASKSSSSDKEKKPATKPPVSRGMSLSAFMMGGPPPSRTKTSSRRSSIAAVSRPSSSRRQSMDVDDIGMLSPPPDDEPELNGKAAKLMGVSAGKLPKKDTTRGKQKAKVIPDPYPIDDDDMVMVNSVEDPVINAPVLKASKSSRKEVGSKSKSRGELKGMKPDDDIVMVEAGPSTDAPEVTTGPDDITFVEKPRNPPPLKRSTTSAKKAAGGLGGLFGFGRSRRVSDSNDRPRLRSLYREEDEGRVREVERKNRRSTRVDTDAEGFTTDAAPAGGETEPEDRVGRKSQRVSRDTELREAEERRARRREAEKVKSKDARDKRAREDEEREERRKEDKRARRAAQDEALAREEQERRDANARAAERHEKRRTRGLSEEPEPTGKSSSRPKSSRRQSQMYPRSGDEDVEVRPELSDRRRSHLEKSSDGRRRHHSDKSFRRKSTIVGDYPAEPTILTHQPTDKTSSWVHSQADDPPEAPPIEPTIMDVPGPAVGAGGYDDGLSAEEDARREIRHKAKRSSKYAGMTDKEVEERRRRKDQRRAEKEQLRSSEGSEGNERERERDRGSHRRSTYVDSGAERVLERPSLGAAGKRGSWFKKITNL